MREKRENDMPLGDLETLVVRVCGAALPDKIVAWLGVSKRNAERWLSGDSTYPPAVVEKLEDLAPKLEALLAELDSVVDHYVDLGVPENLQRMRIREWTKTLSDTPPERPMPPKRPDN